MSPANRWDKSGARIRGRPRPASFVRHLSVRQTENWVRTYRPRRKQGIDSNAELRAIAAGIETKLALPIRLTGSLNRGKIDLRYSSREELERVCAKLLS